MILQALSNAFGPSGCENEVRQVVLDAIADKVDAYQVDHLGNVIAHQKGTANAGFKVMVAAHMDEVGFMITHADQTGSVAETFSAYDPIGLPAALLHVLHVFDGRPTSTVLTQLEAEHRIRLERPYLRLLVDFGVLVAA